jgi:hypothetical protein
MTMTSAGATGSLATSAHPAARNTDSGTAGTASIAAAANAITISSEPHLDRQEPMLGFRVRFGLSVAVKSILKRARFVDCDYNTRDSIVLTK